MQNKLDLFFSVVIKKKRIIRLHYVYVVAIEDALDLLFLV